MKKSLIIIVAVIVLMVGINFVLAKGQPNGSPFQAIWQKLLELETRIAALEGSACTPADEVCDQVDNDCDGDIDEGDVCVVLCDPNTPCDDGDACTVNDTCDYTGNCVAGAPLDCDDGNECTTDDCSPATGCYVVINTSNACDDGNICTYNDACDGSGLCSGVLPPEVGNACDGPDSDDCTNGTFTCGVGGGLECVNEDPADLVEICDGQDNDCDGQTDEDFSYAGQGIGSDCGVGVCASGTVICSSDIEATCSTAGDASDEACDNGIDDDCDGEVDEGC